MIAGVASILAACVLVALMIAMHVRGWDQQNVASWVQAFGSIFAIFGAYYVGEKQASATLRAAQEAHLRTETARREGMFLVMKAAYERAMEIERALDDPASPPKIYSVYHASVIDTLIELMNKLPLSELGSARVAKAEEGAQAIGAFVIFSGQFSFLKRALENYITRLQAQGYDGATIRAAEERKSLRKKIQVHLDEIKKEFGTLDSLLGPARLQRVTDPRRSARQDRPDHL